MIAGMLHEQVFRNPSSEPAGNHSPLSREPLEFHRRLPGYARTPLLDAPLVAESLGLHSVLIKDESSRLGLPAFKILGASWAIYRALERESSHRGAPELPNWGSIGELRDAVAPLRPLTLTCATDGNHGRAVARMSAMLGLDAHILVPSDMATARIDAILGEGATVEVVEGTYDDAVERSAHRQSDMNMVISDTAWPGYEDVPRWVIEGYSTILWEIAEQLHDLGADPPDLVAVQVGVGAFAAAVTRFVRSQWVDPRVSILAVEPTRAACLLGSMRSGERRKIDAPLDSIMSGLNCGEPSPVAWPVLSAEVDAFISVDDERARSAMRLLHQQGIHAGECGAASLAGLRAWPELTGRPLPGSRALLISTEGPTDPAAYAAILEG